MAVVRSRGAPLRLALIILRSASFTLCAGSPVEATGLPDMDQAKEKDKDKEADVGKAGPAQAIVSNSPGSDKDYFDIEDDEKDGHQVEGNRTLETCIIEGQDAGLVRLMFLPGTGLVTKPPGEQQQNRHQKNRYAAVDSQRQI